MNIKLLRRIQRQIKREPRRFVMDQYFTAPYGAETSRCLSAACIAGWAITFTKTKSGKPSQVPPRYHKYHIAQKALNLTEDQCEALFYEAGWPAKFKRGGPLWKRAIARIEHLIETGE